ncbi:complex I NDUFA9 subunit family protein [Thioalkalicoccus limnaeus]|uniref:Complex I NDUFA9 subunit family protein n=1 Tax=Thioalkalicoccus limnaeus TaxID=120681 RepID=A0ABV4B9Q8_9GAMM
MNKTPICILGGTGFVGRHLINALTATGYPCRLILRRPERYRDLRLVPGLEVRPGDLFDAEDLGRHLAGCGTVINLVGILNETRTSRFERVHVELVEHLVAAARTAGVGRLLQMSALHADALSGGSRYLRSKGAGEDLAHRALESGIAVTSFQPSVIFGRGDRFFNRFAGLLRIVPGFFPLACPNARLAPVYVGDVVAAMHTALADPATHGQRYPLCGPRVFRLQELVEYTAATIDRRVRVVGLGNGLSRLQARVFEWLPGQPFTRDNYLSLQTDNVCTRDGLAELGLRATDIAAVVPGYLR